MRRDRGPEGGFVGADRLGRVYDQPPFPHVGPAVLTTAPEFRAARPDRLAAVSVTTTSCWDREWAAIRELAGAPREVRLGCSTVSHNRLDFCAWCVPTRSGGAPNGVDLEVNAWRLLALRPGTVPAVRADETREDW